MPAPWNNWYHVTVHAYGSWLRGDPRGWRARHHREHVDGDYKSPPVPGKYVRLHARSKTLMKRDPVRFAADLRALVVSAVVEKLQGDAVEVLAVGLDGTHLHLLARFVDHRPRHWIGRAKLNASHTLRQRGLRPEGESGGLWAKRSFAKPILDRQHQLRAFRYIVSHGRRGAAVWTFRSPSPRVATRGL